MTEGATDYINFCVDNIIPTRTVRCFPRANDRTNELNTTKPAQHPPLLLSAKQTSHPALTHGFPVKPQVFYLPPQHLHVCLQPNQKMLMLHLPPPSTCVSQEVG
ncbi:hypothetical protein ILYODFUR_037964 [Ilyodon furcidens]|uniref:Uncharacterized protein n=1 Tax=Ilyodon furcidens TaxID=33524 RepID=A0ABV0T6X0_9TELE